MADAVAEDYKTSLEDLRFNSKPHINALTMLAEEYSTHAEVIVHIIEAKLNKAPSNGKLPNMYLMDSIVKNVGGNYTPLFAKNIVKTFFATFDAGDEKTKISLHKLRFTWDNYFPLKKLYELDMTIHNIDSNWPVKPLPPSLQDKPSTSIHVNPKFLKKADPAPSVSKATTANKSSVGVKDSVDLKQDLINKQKQLLDLQQQKLLLELEQTKQQLALREKRNKITIKKTVEHPPKDPRVKQPPSANPASLRVTVPNGQKQQLSARVPQKDPRNNAVTKSKQLVPVSVKKTSTGPAQRIAKPEAQKITSPEANKTKTMVKKSPSSEMLKKKKQSPTNSTKNLKSAKTLSPKNVIKSEDIKVVKKSKITKKKNDGKSFNKNSMRDKEDQHTFEKDHPKKSVERDVTKKRDRPGRRSPTRNQAPPAKQPRRSTSVERRRSVSPPRRNPEFERKSLPNQRHIAIRKEEEHFHRGSPRSTEGSISPRFSPEPDEVPTTRQNWRPTVKRRRQQAQPQTWQEEENMPPRNLPPMRRRSSVDPNLQIPQELTLGHQAEILKQAEIQLQTGQLTHVQHQELLRQLHQLFELQRLRNSQQHHERPLMPLDELLPEQHEERRIDDRNMHNFPVQRGEGVHPSAFRPPPLPPHMDNDREREDFSHPSHRHSPPHMPANDPRMGRNHPPRHEDPRFHNHIKNRPPQRFRDNREHEFSPMDDRPLHEHIPHNRRRGSGNWEEQHIHPEDRNHVFNHGRDSPVIEEPFYSMSPNSQSHRDYPPVSQSSNMEDHGFYGVERNAEPPIRSKPLLPIPKDAPLLSRQGSQERIHGRRENSDLQNGDKNNPERVPLRSYAHPDKMEESKSTTKRRHSHGESDRPKVQRSPPRSNIEKQKRRDRRSPPKSREARKAHVSDGEDDAPLLEEPEDYIIANIPPEAEVYHKHSITLKKSQTEAERAYREHKKNILLSTYTKKIASENASESQEEDVIKPKGMDIDLQTNLALSPDISKRDKLEEEVNKSPSLPLKKRKYHISSSNDPKDSSDGGVMSEVEADGSDKKDDIVEDVTKNNELEKDDIKMEAEEQTETELTAKDSDQENTEHKDQDIEAEPKPEKSGSTEKADEQSSVKETKTKIPKPNKVKKPQRHGSKEKVQKDSDKGKDEKRDEPRKRQQRVGGGKGKQMHRAGSEGKVTRNRLQDKILKEEEEMFRLQMELEKGLEQEEFERMQGRDGPPRGRGGPMRRGWGRGRGDIGPWRGRGRFDRDRRGPRWEREDDHPEHYPSLMNDAPPFPGRRPMDRHLPPGPVVDSREWYGPPDMNREGMGPHPNFDRHWNERDMHGPPFEGNGPGPMRRPMPGPHGERRLPPHPDDRREMGRFRGPMNDHPDRPGPPPPPGPEFNQVNVNKLLSDLLNMGIIPGAGNAAKPDVEKPRSAPASPGTNEKQFSKSPTPTEKPQSDEPLNCEVAKEALSNLFNKPVASVEKETNRVPTPVFEDLLTLDPDANLPEITFDDMDKLKKRCDELIKRIYTGIQCSACGMRFTACQTDMYAEHLDWHYRLNRKDKDGIKDTHRQLYPSAGDWIMYEEIVDPSKRAHNEVFDEADPQEDEQPDAAPQGDPEDLVVPVAQHPDQDKCNVCREAFKTVYNDEEEEWQYVNCVAVEGKNFHPACYADHNDQHEQDPVPPTPVRVPLYNPIESSLKGIPGLDTLIQAESESEENMNEAVQHSAEVHDQGDADQAAESENETQSMESENVPNPIIEPSEDTTTKDQDGSDLPTVADKDVTEESQEAFVENEDLMDTIEQSDEPSTSSTDIQQAEPDETEQTKMEDYPSLDSDITSTEDKGGDVQNELTETESKNEPFVQIESIQSQNIDHENSKLTSLPNVSCENISDSIEVTDSSSKSEMCVDQTSEILNSNDILPPPKTESDLQKEIFTVARNQPPPPGTEVYEGGDEIEDLESEDDSEDNISVEI